MESVLIKIIANPQLHARWLNTLSYLEFMGTRKIARSAAGSYQSEMRLRHLAEEARHAHFFKMMISRVIDGTLPGYELKELFCGLSAIRYFHYLDACVKKEVLKSHKKSLHSTELCYLYVTTLIEERAGGVYHIYDKLLQDAKVSIRLQGIIGEEEVHLQDMHDQLAKNEYHENKILNQLREIEQSLFNSFYKSMIKELSAT